MNCGCARCPVATGRLACDFPTGVYGGLPVEAAIRHAREQMKRGGNPAGVLADNGICQTALAGSYVNSQVVERTDGKAIIRVCGIHGDEVCRACGRDFNSLNNHAREEAKAKADAEAAHRTLGFQPRRILAWTPRGRPKRYLEELAPGTKVTCINRNERRRGEPHLDAEILCTLVNEQFDGHSLDDEQHPRYRIRWLDGQNTLEVFAKVLCGNVHDSEAWRIHEVSVTSMMDALPSASGSSHGTGSGALPADDIDAASLPSSVPTSAVPIKITRHGKERLVEREITERDFQAAVKAHMNMRREQPDELQPGLPHKVKGATVLLLHNGMVFCTEPTLTTMVSSWHMMKQGDMGLIHDLEGARRDLNGRVGTLLSYSDGRWGVDLGDERVRVRLRNLKPPPTASVAAPSPSPPQPTVVLELKSLQERVAFALDADPGAPWAGWIEDIRSKSYAELYAAPGTLTHEETGELNEILAEADDDDERNEMRIGFIETIDEERQQDREELDGELDMMGVPHRYALEAPIGFQVFTRQKPMVHFSPRDENVVYVVAAHLFGHT